MATGYDPNIEGAINVLVDLMLGEGFTMSRMPYAPNYRGLVDALIDLKEGFPARAASSLDITLVAGESIMQGDALYVHDAAGRAFRAVANADVHSANVIGFAKESRNIGQTISVQVAGVLTVIGLDPGEVYFLSAASPGAITLTPPSTPGQYVTRVGEAGSSTQLIIKPEPAILLS